MRRLGLTFLRGRCSSSARSTRTRRSAPLRKRSSRSTLTERLAGRVATSWRCSRFLDSSAPWRSCCFAVLVDPKGVLNVAVSAATLMFVFLPASYAVRIIWTEWSHKWCSKSAAKKRKKIAPQLANKDGEYNNPVVPTGGSGLSFCAECGAQSAGDGGKFCRACGTPSKDDAIEGSGWEAMEPEI